MFGLRCLRRYSTFSLQQYTKIIMLPIDIQFYLICRISTLWLKGLVVDGKERIRSPHCPGSLLLRQLDTLKVSGTEFQNGRLAALAPLLRCAPVINLDLTDNHIGKGL